MKYEFEVKLKVQVSEETFGLWHGTPEPDPLVGNVLDRECLVENMIENLCVGPQLEFVSVRAQEGDEIMTDEELKKSLEEFPPGMPSEFINK